MVRLVAVLAVLVAAGSAGADDTVWPTDPMVRLNAQIAACQQGRAAVCLEVAGELGRRGITSRLGYTPASLRARATKLLDEQCAAGTAASCFEQGRFLANRGDVATGIAKMKRGCELGSGAACVYLASREKKAKRVMELLERACTLDNANGCEAVAAKIEKQDPSRASTLRRKACDGGDATACIKTAEQRRAAGDKAGAFADFESACELTLTARADGAALAACDHAGVLATDATRARELFESACDGGYAAACIHLGERVARGEGGERDWGAGLALVADGCKRTRDTRCKALADLKKQPPDWQCSTFEQCRTHCKEQLWPACRRIVELDMEDVDPTEWLALACTGGDAIGCRMLGDADTSFKTALPHYQKACKLGDATACRYAQLGRALGGSKADVALLRSACGTDRAACALYGLAIARKDRKRAAEVFSDACDHKVGVACRYLARTFDGSSRSGTDAMIDLVIDAPRFGGATCDCENAPPQRSRKEADDEQHRYDESQRLLRLGCAAGDALSCKDTLGPDRIETPPPRPVVVPAWQ